MCAIGLKARRRIPFRGFDKKLIFIENLGWTRFRHKWPSHGDNCGRYDFEVRFLGRRGIRLWGGRRKFRLKNFGS